MAVNTILKSSKVKLELQNGLDENGKEIIKSKTLSSVKTDATDEGIYDSMVSITGLQQLPLTAVKRIDEKEIEMV
ncbi:DUF1659 domain-containing protein [Senegalia massiliensis]|uniref:DUF1659 domain-containing protein n=1 Tax=Senegalia massiliensis TaxID=1720316 RepID=A0A845R056_9CLOT|nr:DUF1659 domain-containing protein [Senegalia massiliensis]NBI07379.1 DUF1659 domain-containing protein [Senegalia massiliensis]